MKKILLTITSLVVTLFAMAQAPNMLNYQGVARNAAGNVLPNQSVGLRLSILTGTSTGAAVFIENRTVVTNAFGLFNVQVGGPGGTVTLGSIAGVNWTAFGTGSGPKFLQVEIDPTGGTNYVNVGSTQMLSVPYALYAAGGAPVGPASGDLTGNYPGPQIFFPLIKTFNATTLTPANTQLLGLTNSATTGTLGAITGTSASNDANASAITGTMSSATPGTLSAGIRGVNNGTNANGSGVIGTHAGGGSGVFGQSVSGMGVNGTSTSGMGVSGTSASGVGVNGVSSTNSSGSFQNTNAANTAATVASTTNGIGDGLSSITTGTGRAALLQVNNAASTASALEAQTNGTGASWAVRATSTGTNGAGLFVQSNAANTANNVQSNQAGLGRAGLFQATNTASTADAVLVSTVSTSTTPAALHATNGVSAVAAIALKKGVWGESDNGLGVLGSSSSSNGVMGTTTTGTAGVMGTNAGTGAGVSGTSTSGRAGDFSLLIGNTSTVLNATTAGTGISGAFDNSNAANLSNTLQAANANTVNGVASATTGGGAAIFARKGAGLASFITNPTALYSSVADPAAGPAGIASLGITNNGLGVVGVSLTNGVAVEGVAFSAGGTAVTAINASTGYALTTSGKVQIQGQGAGVNKVLTSDAAGNATWNALSGVGGVSGTGTLNYVPKWTPNGTTIGNSQLFDDGTNIGLNTAVPNAKFDVVNGSNTNRAGYFTNTSTSNPSSALFVQNNTLSGAATIEGSAITAFLNPLSGAVNTYSLTTPVGIKGFASPTGVTGFTGGTGVLGSSGSGMGVVGLTDVGTAVWAQAMTTGYALQTAGKVQIQGQGAAAGKVLSSDATGNATWNTASSLNMVSGNGTLNYMTKWSPDGNTISNSQVFDDGNSVGVNTNTPSNRLEVVEPGAVSAIFASRTAATGIVGAIRGQSNSQDANASGILGIINSTTPGGFSAAVRGTNNGTGGLGIGVVGTQAGSGWGVYGTTPSGIGVYGLSTSGFGVYGQSTSGVSVYGIQPSNGTNSAGYFQNTNTANASAALFGTTNGTGPAVSAAQSGTAEAGLFSISNAANSANAVNASTNGTGAGVLGTNSQASGPTTGVQGTVTSLSNGFGAFGGVSGVVGLVSPTAPGGYSAGVRGLNNGTGGSGIGVIGYQAGSGWGVYGETPSGFGVYGLTTNGTAVSSGVRGETFSINGIGVEARYSGAGVGVALLVNGAIKVAGPNKAAFVHTAVPANKLDANGTDISNPMCDGDPNAILIVTQKLNPATITYNNSPIGVYFNPIRLKWTIFNENNVAVPDNAQFDVLVIKQ